MTNSEIFQAAHKMAKATRKCVGDYKVALSLALKEIHKFLAKGVTTQRIVRDKSAPYGTRKARRERVKVSFNDAYISEYIKENTRVLVHFDSIKEALEAEENSPNFGKWFYDANWEVVAYQYYR